MCPKTQTVLNRFVKIENMAKIAFTIIISLEVVLALFEDFHKYLPILEPVRWMISAPIYFVLLWILPPMPRRTGKSVYKTSTLVELMALMSGNGAKTKKNTIRGQKTDGNGKSTNPQDGGNTQTSQYVDVAETADVVLLTDDMDDTDTRELANLRLKQTHQTISIHCPGFNERDIRSLLLGFDGIAGRSCVLSSNSFVRLMNVSDDTVLLVRWYDSLLFQSNTNTGIDFFTHAAAVYDFCTASRPRLAMLVFEIYDLDNGGDLDRDEIRVLLKEINSGNTDVITEEDIDRFDADNGGTVDREEFENAAANFPALLRPAYKLQRSLRESTLSLRRWEQIAAVDAARVHATNNMRRNEDDELEIIEMN